METQGVDEVLTGVDSPTGCGSNLVLASQAVAGVLPAVPELTTNYAFPASNEMVNIESEGIRGRGASYCSDETPRGGNRLQAAVLYLWEPSLGGNQAVGPETEE